MPERAIFLDRDNTIIEDREGYLGDPKKVRLLPGAATAIASMRRLGYRIIVASNQSGVARGMFTETDVEAVNDEMSRQLREQASAQIDASYYCPYHPDAKLPEYKLDHEWRKPKPGMLKQAAEDFNLDLGQSWMIGDLPRDIACGAAAGCRTILIRDPDHPAPEHESNALHASPNFIVKSLADAARIILREGRNPHPDLVPKPLPASALAPAALPITPPIAAPIPPAPPTLAPAAPIPTPAPIPPAALAPTPTDSIPSDIPLGQEIPAGTPPHITIQLDEQALADRIARTVTPQPAPKTDPGLRAVMDEILVQLRHQSRQADMPEFSLARLIAIMVQLAVAICLLLGIVDAYHSWMTAEADANKYWLAYLAGTIRAGLWLLGALTLQGFVIALLVGSRRK